MDIVKKRASDLGKAAGAADQKLEDTIGEKKAGYLKGAAKFGVGVYSKSAKTALKVGMKAGDMVAKHTSLDEKAKAMYKQATGKDFDDSVAGAKEELAEIAKALEEGHAEGKGE
eukprot:CAMPEP_0182925272 /NCGR_PEP_ID=MMETSP0105_2-20130417/9012_1 /TAXON_ID=81532 ORGANISM="Acanthoeca-like sp., Strain 10tr" /NCGR_SAMPLE_ID=MMETSP0105_2 /ASSEMBLY_ACC=CAM_ASM_000205 /LENGTH=113 /DNA_ID=CAMNT_0025063113 /DNA_START=76 /DNA_END=417 /DNA_ORIENTATION=+